MSKDFEQAYRELAEREIPDLWDRIEAGLESKSTPEDGKEKIEDVRNDIRDDKRKKVSCEQIFKNGSSGGLRGSGASGSSLSFQDRGRRFGI